MRKSIAFPDRPISKITIHDVPDDAYLLIGGHELVKLNQGTNVVDFAQLYKTIWEKEKEFFALEKNDPSRIKFSLTPAEMYLVILSGVSDSLGDHVNQPPPESVNLSKISAAVRVPWEYSVEFE